MHCPIGTCHRLRDWSLACQTWRFAKFAPRTRQLHGLVLPASQFQDILEDVGETCAAYGQHPLAQLTPSRRGLALQAVAQSVLQSSTGAKVEAPAPGPDACERRRSALQAAYDFTMSGKRIECKSAQLYWSRSDFRWQAHFRAIKLNQDIFDDLYLTLYTPSSLLILKHDLRTRVHRQGVLTSSHGCSVVVTGSKHMRCWKEAACHIVHALFSPPSRCEQLAVLDVNGPEVKEALSGAPGAPESFGKQHSESAFDGTPLQYASPAVRGLRVEALAFEIDRLRHPQARFRRSVGEKAAASCLKGLHASSADWLRDDIRLEVKHSRLQFREDIGCWFCTFSNIKFASDRTGTAQMFDELWLAVFSPFGLHFLKHNGVFGVSSQGLNKCQGARIRVVGPANEPNVKAALEQILCKLTCGGCEPIATVLFD